MKKVSLSISLLIIFLTFVFTVRKYHGETPVNNPPGPANDQTGEVVPPTSTAPLTLVSQTVTLEGGEKITFRVPEGFTIAAAAEDLGRARFMAWSPEGRLFVTDMKDLSDNKNGKVYILEGWNAQTKTFAKKTAYLNNLRNPNSLTFYTDPETKQTWLYVTLTDHLVRYKYDAGDTAPSGAPEILATFPDYGLSYKYGGWHLTRTVAIHDKKVYVAVGSSCNACEERADEPSRASIMVMDLDGANQRVYASSLRNAVGIKWVGDKLFATDMGVDHLGNDVPADTFQQIKDGANYGWPYCYETGGKVFKDTSPTAQGWRAFDCGQVPVSYAAFDAHSAPLGLEYFSESMASDPALENYFLVALHGSGVVSIGHGNAIVRVSEHKTPEVFIDGFLDGDTRRARPADIIAYGNNAFFFTDDLNGTLYYVSK